MSLGFGEVAGISLGSDLVNAYAAHREAKLNRDWQERMSNTAHTREVADLRRAGLNPALSVMSGRGASTPSGAVARPEVRAPHNAVALAQVGQIKAETARTEAETRRIRNLLPIEVNIANAERMQRLADFIRTKQEALQLHLGIPELQAKSAAWQSYWGTHGRAYMGDFKEILQGIATGAGVGLAIRGGKGGLRTNPRYNPYSGAKYRYDRYTGKKLP